MPPFSNKDIDEAKRRVREMQQRADSYLPPRTAEAQDSHSERPAAESSAADENSSRENKSENAESENTLPFANLSDGGIIILVMLILLWGEGADNKLLLALLYLLL